MSRRRAALLCAAALLGLSGCTAAAGQEPAAGSAGQPSLQPVDPAVQQAYLAYWDAWIAANSRPGADSSGLSAVAAEPNLGVLRASLQQEAKAGRLVRGTVGHHIEGMVVDGERRRIYDCVDLIDWSGYDARTGSPLHELRNRPQQLAVSTLRLVDGAWKVTDGQEPQPC